MEIKHIKRTCRFCRERFYTEDHKQFFCMPEHARKYHIIQCNLKTAIRRSKQQIEKHQNRLFQKQYKLRMLVQ